MIGTGAFVLLYASFLFIGNSAPPSSAELTKDDADAATPYAAPKAGNVNAVSSLESVTSTLKNIRLKGDSINIQCSGPTGSVVCKSDK